MQIAANQNYGKWKILFRTQQHKFLLRLQKEISKAGIRDRPSPGQWMQLIAANLAELTNIKHSPPCAFAVIKVQIKVSLISQRKVS